MNNNLVNQIKDDITKLAKTLFKEHVKQASEDGEEFLNATRGEVEKWLGQLARGEITKKNFESLMRGERDLARMEALKRAGLAQVTIDTFVRGVIDIIINAATKLV